MKRILDHDPVTGITETYHKTDSGFMIQTSQNVAPILDRNRRISNAQDDNWKGDWHHIASIPLVIVQQWWSELGSDPLAKENRKWLIAKLQDREWRKLRTKEGNL